MTDTPAYEDLIQLVDQVEMATSQPNCWIASPVMWTFELEHHPDRFRRDDNGELIWLGFKVVVTMTFSGADKLFWSMVDKIIPKEKQNDL